MSDIKFTETEKETCRAVVNELSKDISCFLMALNDDDISDASLYAGSITYQAERLRDSFLRIALKDINK